ncbi:hypothetical protein GCM10009108_00760 [Castellaniella ginsengisoli]|uniref:4'-phosphopantetheinyl transferase N-terminal domain-containing protein n=1 Tax=Castellaniella ginsengisoli TaxID=546114 RepID=A0ABN1KNV1_9BURK
MPHPDPSVPYQVVLSRGLPDEAGAVRLRRDLPEAEWGRIARLRQPDDRLRSLVGRALARRLLGQRLGRAPAKVSLGAGPRGKPMLVETGPHASGMPPALHFNIAHSGDLVLVGVGPEPLGVDVEHCPDSVDAALWRLITGRPPPPEAPPDPRALCAHWVRREAVLKACGLGLAAEPGTLRLADADAAGWSRVSGRPEVENLRVRLLWSSPDHCAALCLPDAAIRPPACASAGSPPSESWSLRTQALADWIGAPRPAT